MRLTCVHTIKISHRTLVAQAFAGSRTLTFPFCNLPTARFLRTHSAVCSVDEKGNGRSVDKSVPYESSLHKMRDVMTAPGMHFPAVADVVVIGGGSVGCSTAYHLAKMGAGNVVLLEKHKLTAGTTWHTAGLLWRLVSHDYEMQITEHTRKLMTEILPEESGQETGWVQTGGLFTAYTEERMDAYRSFSTLGKCFGIESCMMTPAEISDLHPLLDVTKLVGGCYSPLDGTIDPAGACITYTRAATKYGAKIFEDCGVNGMSVKEDSLGLRRVEAVDTDMGTIKTNAVVNCTGVWAPYIGEMVGVVVPQVIYKHAYVVTEPIPGINKTPNVRDHDGSVYLKRQGDTLQVGGYESNPVHVNKIERDFAFGLYDLDWDVFGRHIEVACDIVPAISQTGIRSTVCGPESFTPDRLPLLGESPHVRGFFFGSGFNSGGMMLGGGAGKEIANWVMKGRPDIDLFAWDIRRFPSSMIRNKTWLTEKSHEAYAKHYSIAYHYDQPLAGRNARLDALHETLLKRGCYYEEKHGLERPGYFIKSAEKEVAVKDYDYYGYYGVEKHANYPYRDQLEEDYTFDYPREVHKRIGVECLTCRTKAAVFNSSYMGKLFITGRDASRAARHLFSRDVSDSGRCTYTLMLNDKGGIESDLIVTKQKKLGGEHEYYMTVGGSTTEYCKGHLQDNLAQFNCKVEDRTADMSIISIQGPLSREILQKVSDDEKISKLKFSRWMATEIGGVPAVVMRLSFVGELGYEIHCDAENAIRVYDLIMEETEKSGGCDAGYRAMESMSTETGFHHWGHSIRTDDSPLEARLLHLCDHTPDYLGSDAVKRMRDERPEKILTCFTVDRPVRLFGHEAILLDDEVVGYTRNAVHGFGLNKEIAFGYVRAGNSLSNLSDGVISKRNYVVERMGVKYPAEIHLCSPFDPQFRRMMGKYDAEEQAVLRLRLRSLSLVSTRV